MSVFTLMIAGVLGIAAPDGDTDVRGSVGVCIRWGSDPHHVADAIVVVGSGNPTLDRAVPDTIKNMEWERPNSPTYHGEWIGIVMAVDGSAPNLPLPSCDGLPRPTDKPVA